MPLGHHWDDISLPLKSHWFTFFGWIRLFYAKQIWKIITMILRCYCCAIVMPFECHWDKIAEKCLENAIVSFEKKPWGWSGESNWQRLSGSWLFITIGGVGRSAFKSRFFRISKIVLVLIKPPSESWVVDNCKLKLTNIYSIARSHNRHLVQGAGSSLAGGKTLDRACTLPQE